MKVQLRNLKVVHLTSAPIVDYYKVFLPRLRDEIVFGPPQQIGAATIYHVKDRFTNAFYRIGSKEYFLLSRMDGTRTLQEISAEYAQALGRQLNDRSWEGLFRLIEKRQMLANTANTTALEKLKKEAEWRIRQEERRSFRRRFVLIKPDKFLERLLPWCQFAFHRGFVLPALCSIAAIEILLAVNLQTIITEAIASRNAIPSLLVTLALSWLFVVFHETAHGLTCKKFGGSVNEIGIMWRYLSFFAYCKIDDVRIFHNRWHRVYTAFAGVFINLLTLIPFAILWIATPAHSFLNSVSADMLVSLNASTLVNFIPFIELDGYFMLNYSLDMVDLRKESHRFWKRGLQKRLFDSGEGNTGYTQRDRYIYFFYGILSLTVTTILFPVIIFYWFSFVNNRLGSIIAWALLLLVTLLLLFRGKETIKEWRKTILALLQHQ